MSKLNNHEAIRRSRALVFLRERALEGMKIAEIAARHNVSRRTVERTLNWAEKAQIYVEIEDQLLQEGLPAAADALIDIIKHSDDDRTRVQAITELMKGLNVFKKVTPITAKDVQEQHDLVAHITRIRNKAQLEANTIPGELVERPEPAGLLEGTLRRESELDSGESTAPTPDDYSHLLRGSDRTVGPAEESSAEAGSADGQGSPEDA